MRSTFKNLITASTTCGLVAVSIASFPMIAQAQDTNPGGQTSADASNPNGPMINKFDLEDVDLYTAFTLLFTQAKVNYTLDPSLRQHTISIHQRTPTRFRQLLEVMLNYSTAHGLPLTYTVEDGYYNIVPKMETTDNSSSSSTSNEVAPPTWNKPYHMPLSTFNFNPEFLISIFGGRRIYAASGLNTQGAGYGSGGMGGGMMGGMGGMGGGMMGGMGGMGGGMMGGMGGMGGGMMGGMGGMGGGMMGGMGGGMMGGGMMGGMGGGIG